MLSEFEIINKIRKDFPKIGDDCAEIIIPKPGKKLITSTDAFVEGTHFKRQYFSGYDIGYKSFTASISDIAACGGTPKCGLIALGMPNGENAFVNSLYNGIKAVSKKYKVEVIGGDTVLSPFVFVSITVIGETEKFITRRGAKVGNMICVTGPVGSASAGLVALEKGIKSKCTKNQLNPEARVQEGLLLAPYASSMIDISDGLISDLTHILEESKVSAKIFPDKIPIDKEVFKVAKTVGRKAEYFALNGGEDYELLFTIPAQLLKKAKDKIKFTEIGEIIPRNKKPQVVDAKGSVILAKGFDHFKKSKK
ncbi:MAG: thiamine-phosphate kinase [bacterium]|nr:thiamine-phosphate kinase [bacterium]